MSTDAWAFERRDNESCVVTLSRYKMDDPTLITSVLNGESMFLGPTAVLDGLSTEAAHAKPHNLPHSIVAHMCFWQEWFGAVHGGHHLGQIITMRQLMGLWPPAAGSMTW